MKLLLNPTPVKTPSYIKHNVYDNLFVIPYVKGRLVFAELVARAIIEGEFEQVLIDLPGFMNNLPPKAIPIHLFPLISSLIIKNNDGGGFITLPFTPNDAATMAIAAAQLVNNRSPLTLRYIDDAQIIQYQDQLHYPEIDLPEDYNVLIDGLEHYFGQAFDQLSTAWKGLPEDKLFYTHHRGAQVAENISQSMSSGKRTLLVCDYRLWQLVNESLITQSYSYRSRMVLPWSDHSAAVVLENPYQLWAMGLLDDYPTVVEAFYRMFQEQRLDDFDKFNTINSLIGECITDQQHRTSNRRLLTFRHYLIKRLCTARRYIPLPTQHLFDAAHSCIGHRFAYNMEKKFLHYPFNETDTILHFLHINKDCIIPAYSALFDIPDLHERVQLPINLSSLEAGESLIDRLNAAARVFPTLNKREQNDLEQEHGFVSWELESEYRIHQILCSQVRNTLEQKERDEDIYSKRNTGSLCTGIHTKATIASFAAGENAIYVKKKRPTNLATTQLNEATPTVFMFTRDLSDHSKFCVHDSNITQRKTELLMQDQVSDSDPDPDSVYSIYATFANYSHLCNGHIKRRELSSIVFLYSNYTGVERYNHICKRAKQSQCRSMPHSDPELDGFSNNDLGIAWAIKYATEYVIIVACDDWSASTMLTDYAYSKNIKFLNVSMSSYSPEFIERIKIMHEISTPLKISAYKEQILDRFVQH